MTDERGHEAGRERNKPVEQETDNYKDSKRSRLRNGREGKENEPA